MTSSYGSTHVFCEAKYEVDFRVAEFYNTITSSFYLASAVVGATLTKKHKSTERKVAVFAGWICVAAIGAGRAVFHAMLTFNAQLCDEIPMIAFVLILIAGKSNCIRDGLRPAAARTGVLLLSFALICCAAIYVSTRVYAVFLVTFTIGVVSEVTISCTIKEAATPQSRRALKRATLLIALGGIVWAIESQFCDAAPSVWMLHPVWHALSAVSAFYAVIHVSHLKEL